MQRAREPVLPLENKELQTEIEKAQATIVEIDRLRTVTRQQEVQRMNDLLLALAIVTLGVSIFLIFLSPVLGFTVMFIAALVGIYISSRSYPSQSVIRILIRQLGGTDEQEDLSLTRLRELDQIQNRLYTALDELETLPAVLVSEDSEPGEWYRHILGYAVLCREYLRQEYVELAVIALVVSDRPVNTVSTFLLCTAGRHLSVIDCLHLVEQQVKQMPTVLRKDFIRRVFKDSGMTTSDDPDRQRLTEAAKKAERY